MGLKKIKGKIDWTWGGEGSWRPKLSSSSYGGSEEKEKKTQKMGERERERRTRISGKNTVIQAKPNWRHPHGPALYFLPQQSK